MPPAHIIDKFGRPITYLRLAVTDRCNLRCFYCMPEEGIKLLPKKEMLTYEEMQRLITLFTDMGIEKLRITGGEPFVRKDMLQFLEDTRANKALKELHITTNGVLTAQYVDQLKALNITSINLSLDTLDRQRFAQITRRDELPKVLETLDLLLKANIKVKINMVVMEGKNTQDIVPMAQLASDLPVSVRFIEEMPFNGTSAYASKLTWDHNRILGTLTAAFPKLESLPTPTNSTASLYQIPGFNGNLGIIAAYTRTFCGSCNRIRVTPQGILKTCLYDHGSLDLKVLLRDQTSDEDIKSIIQNTIINRHKDGWAAQASRPQQQFSESMSSIGG